MSSHGNNLETLDLRGQQCPYPFVHTRLTLEDMPPGSMLRIIVDNKHSSVNVPKSLDAWGQQVCQVQQCDGDLWEIIVRKKTDEQS